MCNVETCSWATVANRFTAAASAGASMCGGRRSTLDKLPMTTLQL
ncbi:hypothetical protein GQ600_7041 [Phytophthora cactorum]|nr:hypothetical protein GQ600_27207 [Phytophthora cactorum]KAF1794212.1 hypothetical protein GQ600_7041 [Phytophthora cactorum]